MSTMSAAPKITSTQGPKTNRPNSQISPLTPLAPFRITLPGSKRLLEPAYHMSKNYNGYFALHDQNPQSPGFAFKHLESKPPGSFPGLKVSLSFLWPRQMAALKPHQGSEGLGERMKTAMSWAKHVSFRTVEKT